MKHFIIILSLLSCHVASFSQLDSIPATQTDSVAETSTLTVGLSFTSNADYYGQRSEEKMPFLAVLASYKHRSGFFVNALSYRLFNKEAKGFGSAYGAGVGFAVKMKKGWSTEVGYQYTFFPKHSPFLQAANPHAISGSISKEAAVTTTLEASYNFGKTNDAFATLAISKQLSLFSFTRKDVVVFTPLFDISGGTQRYYSYYVKEKSIRDSLAGTILGPILGGGGQSQNDTATSVVTSFDLLSYNLKLPIAYSRANYLIELSTQFSLLSNKAQLQPGKINTFFTASFYYQF